MLEYRMFTDTHCHLSYLSEKGLNLSELLVQLCDENFRFILDASTLADDLEPRLQAVRSAVSAVDDANLREKINAMIHYSAGIWPDPDSIRNRAEKVKVLEETIKNAEKNGVKVCALGECGLDHHWNPAGVDCRSEDDFDNSMLKAETELFEMQLSLAEKLSLPVVVHSRDAFEQTFGCIKNAAYNNGEIHCFSYGIDEARAFLDLGWYIALGGAVTYTKKSRLDEMRNLIRFIPDDMLLLETDAPFLAPVPERGHVNTPRLIRHTYEYIAQFRECSVQELAEKVYANSCKLFAL